MTHDHSIQVLEGRIKQLKNLVNDEISRTQSLLNSISESNFTSQHHIESIKELSATVEMLRNPTAAALRPGDVVLVQEIGRSRDRKKVDGGE